jgi:hypothetical protein
VTIAEFGYSVYAVRFSFSQIISVSINLALSQQMKDIPEKMSNLRFDHHYNKGTVLDM